MLDVNQDVAIYLIKNTQLIENAAHVYSTISIDFLNSLSEYVKNYFKNDSDWRCDYTKDHDNLCFGKKNWSLEDNRKIGCFYLWYEKESDDYEYLTIAVGNTPKSLAFGFTSDYYNLAGLSKKDFRNFILKMYKDQKLNDQFTISDDGRGIKISFKLSADNLADSYPKFENSFDEIKRVLDTIKNNINKFDNIVNDLKQKI